MQPDNLVTLTYEELVAQTPTAYQLKFGNKVLWVPKAICDLDKEESTATIHEWYAVDKELIPPHMPEQEPKPDQV